jgi:hypothetical protein
VTDGENIKLAISCNDKFNDFFHIGLNSRVTCNAGTVYALSLKLCFHCLSLSAVAGCHNNLSTLIAIGLGNSPAQSAVAPVTRATLPLMLNMLLAKSFQLLS